MQGLIGKKIGMTRFFDRERGTTIPVTIVQAGMNIIHQVKTAQRDGYRAVQLGFDRIAEKKMSRALAGHFRKQGSEPTRVVREFRLDAEDEELKSGGTVGVEILEGVKYVDVVGTSKGRGFSGTIKRYGFHRGRETHGNKNVRPRGSLGAGTFPARVFPGLKMAGHYGAQKVTAKGVEVIGLDKEEGLVFLKGSIPGSRGVVVYLHKNSTKRR